MNNKKIIAIVAVIALVAILGVCLVACNADSYEKKLKDAGYKTTKIEGGKDEGYDVDWVVTGTKITVTVTVTKYVNTDDAKKVEAEAKDLGVGYVYRTGKIVIWSTSEQGIKDAK